MAMYDDTIDSPGKLIIKGHLKSREEIVYRVSCTRTKKLIAIID